MCSCQSYSQKTWLRQHRKWLSTDRRRGSKVGPQCAEPEALADRHMLTLKDSELCPLPSVGALEYTAVDPYNFLVTWESPDTNLTGLRGFIVAYHRLDRNDQVRKYRVGPTIRGFRIQTTADDTRYLVCVITRGSSHITQAGGERNEEEEVVEEKEEELDELDEFYVMPLEWTREERDVSDDEYDITVVNDDDLESNSGGFDLTSFFDGSFISGLSQTNGSRDSDGNVDGIDAYPSSNDTDLLVTRPTVVNLGSRSSKCIQLRTPPDPAKLSLIDNKRVSVVIGVTMGLLVFVCIIVSIVMVKPSHKEDDDHNAPETSLATDSHKSPGGRSNNAISLDKTAGGQQQQQQQLQQQQPERERTRQSRAASITSSVAARMLEEADGNTSGTLSRLRKQQQQQQQGSETLSRRKMPQNSEKHQRPSSRSRTGNPHPPPSRQRLSSTSDSRRSSDDLSNGNRRNSEEEDHEAVNYRRSGVGGGQSWHGTPRMDNHHTHTPLQHRTTLPRRNNEHHRLLGSGVSLDTADALLSGKHQQQHQHQQQLQQPRRSNNPHHHGSTTSIPLVEYHVVDATSDPPASSSARFLRMNHHHHHQLPPPPRPHHGFGFGPPSVGRWGGGSAGGSGGSGGGGVRPKMTNQFRMPPPTAATTATTASTPLAVTAASNMEDLEGIDYFPSDGGLGGGTGGSPLITRTNSGPRSYVKYNSFANY